MGVGRWVDGGGVVGGLGWHEGSEGIMLLELADPELKTDRDFHCMLGAAREVLMEMRVERGGNNIDMKEIKQKGMEKK